ncbi:hypothetical protein D9Q98_002274 [Chlorella vulgaris]|uniref:Uncharacterized protein n=1 Tax=Chlorella vulgaris TaxID=3077 RepID=A0A9D4TWJ1_CHLVU|nr:hypothetical protein D9Q98_002274 [Chlorella vulgaris]
MVAAAVAQSQAFAASRVAARQPRAQRTVRVAAVHQTEAAPAAPLRFLAAGLAAAAVTLSIPTAAEAGVVLVQPQVKNFVTDTPAAKAPANSSPAAKKAAAYKEESSSAGGLSFEAFRPLVLPASLLAIAGGGIVASKLDPEFAELFSREWSAKDNNITGTGYETTPGLKDTPFYGGSNTNGIDIKRASEPTKTRKRMNEMPNEKKNFFGIGSDTPGTQLGVKASGTTKTRKRMNELPNEKKNFFGIR